MKKRNWKTVACCALIAGLLCACGGQEPGAGDTPSAPVSEAVRTEQPAEEQSETPEPEEGGNSTDQTLEEKRPMLIDLTQREPESIVVAGAAPYTIEPDFSNVVNKDQFYLEGEIGEKLAGNGFVVYGGAGSEFFEIYETNRYSMTPSFVTVDSLMHTYHMYFSYLLRNVERTYLADRLAQISGRLLADSMAQYDRLKDTEWENAARRNVAFFTVGALLQDENTAVEDYVEDTVRQEVERIRQARDIQESLITGKNEDYTQYVPRGYYEGDAVLEQYFRTMMWYGRIHFEQRDEDLDRSALLMTLALSEDRESRELWDSVYAVTSFFAGASDDLGICEYGPVMREAYGEEITVEDLPGNQEAFDHFHALTGVIGIPRINSVPIQDGEENTISGFRLMGQRFTVDAAIMQSLIYSDVAENSAGIRRMLPDVLDVPAALGSDKALDILEENGHLDYAGYRENMEKLRGVLGEENGTLWSASLYAGWLNTLRPLLEPKGEGYPLFMQNEEWLKKDLECFAGSFAELKHDTILYSKQVMAEMGGAYDEADDRGYVEPEPAVYSRFVSLSRLTAQGLSRYGMLSPGDEENLNRLTHIAEQLLEISKKELREVARTDEEYEFIRTYGGNIEHLWKEALKDEDEGNGISSAEFPAAIVVDVATDPNGQVLEMATGNPDIIYVVVNVEGSLRIARGSVYSFYQFPWPMDERLTDSQWRWMMGLQADEDGNYNFEYDSRVIKPEWTGSYRYVYTQ